MRDALKKNRSAGSAGARIQGSFIDRYPAAKFAPLPDRTNITGMNATMEITGRRDE